VVVCECREGSSRGRIRRPDDDEREDEAGEQKVKGSEQVTNLYMKDIVYN
jgi:hypothetical protein